MCVEKTVYAFRSLSNSRCTALAYVDLVMFFSTSLSAFKPSVCVYFETDVMNLMVPVKSAA